MSAAAATGTAVEAPALAAFRAEFASALMAPADVARAAPFAHCGFEVYRNTVRRGCIDALLAQYPSVARLTGDDWMRAAAAAYVETHWPREPRLIDYGHDFPVFLAAFGPATELMYLAEVARLDRAWTESHLAADAPVLTLAALVALGEALAQARLQPHPAARWGWHPAQPAYEIWRRQREGDDAAAELTWQPDGALLTRPDGAVHWQALSCDGVRLLDHCATGLPLEAALQAAQIDTERDAPPLLAALVGAGAFAAPIAPASSSPAASLPRSQTCLT